jgi:uncharacterized protein
VEFLIDGYNLLHAIGWASPRMKKAELEPARRRLLDWLVDSVANKTGSAKFRVVFDAMHGPSHTRSETSHRGMPVTFAYKSTADDRIEELLDEAREPKRLVVVSNDTRLHESARRVKAKGWFTPAFLDWLAKVEEQAKPVAEQTAPEKPEGPPPPDEAKRLLEVFEIPITKSKRKR